MLLEGLHIPLTTPFHPDGRLNLPKLAANVVRYSRTPAAGLIVLGPSGEPTLLSDDETREVLRTAAASAAPEKVLIAGISRDSVHATLTLANFAAEQNYDAILVPLPSFRGQSLSNDQLRKNELPSERERRLQQQRTFFQSLADRSPLPVILFSEFGHPVSQSLAATLSTHTNILGMIASGCPTQFHADEITSLVQQTATINREMTVTNIFAAVTGRMQKAASSQLVSLATPTATVVEPPHMKPALRARRKSVGFQIISAQTRAMFDALNAGAIGVSPAFAACAPQACYEVFAAWKDGDRALAAEKQSRLLEAARLAERFGPAALKYACDLNGYYGGHPRLPHLPLTGEQRAALEAAMKDIRN